MSDNKDETVDADDGDATIDADPELLAELKGRAAAQQAALGDDPTDTDGADQNVLADLRQQAQASQAAAQQAAPSDNTDPPAEPAAAASPRHSLPDEPVQVPEQLDDVESTATTTLAQDGGRANSATAFVRKARDSSDTKGDIAPKKDRKGNGLVVLVAIVLGAQILAAGAFFTLRSLQSDENEEVAEVTAEGADLDAIVPTPIPGGATAAPLNATPTPVPPTPVWQPITEGPRTNPFSFSVEAIVNKPAFFDGPDGSNVTPDTPIMLTSPRASGEPLVLLVAQGEPGDDWAQVAVPGSDNPVWVDTTEFTWRSSNTVIQIDIRSNRVRIFEGNEVLHFDFVATGRLDNPTQQVVTWTIEDPIESPISGDTPHPVALLAAVDGQGQSLTIGLADGFIEGDGYITDGTVLVLSETAAVIAEHVRAGSRVEFVGTPPRPTPTPIPTPTANPEALVGAPPGSSSGGGSPGCSGGQGTPPNCYRVVDRPSEKGKCESYQVELNGSCTLFGGDKNLADPNQPECPAAAPDVIDDRCYKIVGPVPEIPGDCPPEAQDVDGECRVKL